MTTRCPHTGRFQRKNPKRLRGQLTRAEWFALAKSEAERIGQEHGVPVVKAGRDSAEFFRRYGPCCFLDNALGAFSAVPCGYYQAGQLMAVRYLSLIHIS